MYQVIFVMPDGQSRTVTVAAGESVMDAALDHLIPGIKAQCGGAITCSTCHCYVDNAWVSRIPPAGELEKTMLEYVWQPRKNSRLCCQLVMDANLDGIVVHVPVRQG